MIEYFTGRARQVMALADQEAQRLNHKYIGTEHILLGLLREGSGVGAKVLKHLDVELAGVRSRVEELMGRGTPGLDPVTPSWSPQAKAVLEFAAEDARSLHHSHIGTEHLLLGVLRQHDGVTSEVLRDLGLNLEEVRQQVHILLEVSGEAGEPRPAGVVPDPAWAESIEVSVEPLQQGCEICGRIEQIRRGEHPGFITGLTETYVVLGDNQGLRGWCVLLLKGHREHLADLDVARQCLVFADVARVAAAVKRVVRPRRINYECLGNVVPHIHWHVIPRHEDDPEPRAPVWGWGEERLKGSMSEAERGELVKALRAALH